MNSKNIISTSEGESQWRDLSYLELALALRNARDESEVEEKLVAEFVRREHEYVTIQLSDYMLLQKARQILEAVKHLVHDRWIHEREADDECYMLALSEILNRYHVP